MGGDATGEYPEQWEADVVTADGGTVHVRPVRPDDADGIVDFHGRQSPESIYFRFFSPRPRLSEREIHEMTHVDYADRTAFVALLGDEVVGFARYDRWPGRDEAEAAIAIDDAHHGQGFATILLEYLAASAREAGLRGLTAQVLPSNRKMLSVFRQAGFEAASRFADGVIEVRFSIEPTATAVAAMEARARRSEGRSVARFLAPASVAVIGASREPGTVGHEAYRHLVDGGFTGAVHAVNTAGSSVDGAITYASVLDVPEPIDLAVVTVPRDAVAGVIAECAEARVRAAVVVATGFAESGSSGAAAEREILAVARSRGLRLLGPGSMGVVNTDPAVRLHATAVPIDPPAGTVGLGTEAGALGSAILDRAAQRGIGISTFVSVGNRADISVNDLLRYWEDDERTRVVLLHVTSFGNPRRFGRIAREVSAHKPVVAVRSHAGALVDALLRQTGIISVDSLDQLLDVGRVLSTQPCPTGDGLAVVGNAPDATRLAIDAIESGGARVAVVTELGPDAAGPAYGRAVAAALTSTDVGGVVVVHAPPLPRDAGAVARAVADAAAARPDKPVVASLLHVRGPAGDLPNFTFPDAAGAALAAAARYARWRLEPEGVVVADDEADLDAVRAIVDDALAARAGGGRLDVGAAFHLLDAWGITTAAPRLADSVDEAVAHAKAIGGPVALKATGVGRLAKTEAGGVAVDLQGPDDVRLAYERMRAALGDAMVPAFVQPMVAPGLNVRVGAAIDPTVGPAVSFGLGGAGTDLEPVSPDLVRIVPLTDVDAARLVAASAATATLAPADREAVETLLQRVADLLELVPEVAGLFLNPVIVANGSATVVDAQVRVAPWRHDRDFPVRRIDPA